MRPTLSLQYPCPSKTPKSTPIQQKHQYETHPLVSVSGRVICKVSAQPHDDVKLAEPTLWTDNQTTTFLRAAVDCLDDIDQLLLILQDPIQLVVVTSTEIAHHVFVSEEEHEGDGVVEFVHLLEVGDLIEIADVDDGEVLDTVGDAWETLAEVLGRGCKAKGKLGGRNPLGDRGLPCRAEGMAGKLTVKNLILSHAIWVPVTTEADDYQTLLLRHDGLVDVPAGNEVG